MHPVSPISKDGIGHSAAKVNAAVHPNLCSTKVLSQGSIPPPVASAFVLSGFGVKVRALLYLALTPDPGLHHILLYHR